MIVTLSARTRRGMPLMILGTVPSSVIWALSGSMTTFARATIGPRSSGPRATGTISARPNGAPSYGPVRYARPCSTAGLLPAPASTLTLPIALSPPHAPADACASSQGLTVETLASRPAGSTVLTFERYCSPSARVMLTVNVVCERACEEPSPTLWPSAKGSGEGQPVVVKLAVAGTARSVV